MSKNQENFISGSSPEQFSEKEIKSARELKEAADLKQQIVSAVNNNDLVGLIEAMRALRYVLLQLDKVENERMRERKDNLHIDDGYWGKQLQEFLDALEKDRQKEAKTRFMSNEIYLDGVSRIFLQVSADGTIELLPSQVSNPEVKGRLNTVKTSYEAYYGKDGDPETASINPALKAYIESRPAN